MKPTTAIVLLGVGTVFFAGFKYYQGIYHLQYGLRGIGFQGQQVVVDLVVYNPTRWSYPVPMLFFNVYDIDGNYFGMVNSNQMQWVRPGENIVRAFLVANISNIVQSLAALIVPGATLQLMLDGKITVGGKAIPLQIPIEQTIAL